jgi:hypothetical protein
MRAPRGAWIGYGIAVAAVLTVVGVLSALVWRLDVANYRNQAQAARLAKVRLALWRLDGYLTPVFGRLAGLRYSHYVPAYSPADLVDKPLRAKLFSRLSRDSSAIVHADVAWPG